MSMSLKQPKIVISGGGTGGHIFPAIAIADALRRKLPTCSVLFIGAKGRMEMQRVPLAGYEIKGLWISGIQRSLSLHNLSFPVKLVSSLFRAWAILKSFKPDLVIGVGGYASGPTLRAAIWLRIPTLIQEQNSFPGITNKLLGNKVDKICVAYEHMEQWFPPQKTKLTGNPLRKEAVDVAGKRTEGLKFFMLESNLPVVLLIGGSQGARALNQAVEQNLSGIAASGTQFIWQTGESFFDKAVASVEKMGYQHLIKPVVFINRMDLAYACADLIISRAGAMAISEIAVIGKPAIFIPLPTAAENHQMKNARRLSDAGAASIIENHLASQQLIPEMLRLLNNPEQLNRMMAQLARFAIADADEQIAAEAIKLMSYEH
jgi:UDP-N-acetylglucosamine--N-acetylmuramyl-(pentapeptide) pyrophosphoryl-undecaprenol N-acetylglucosamine transferase